MYNGIGLSTTRGSGTNGYVQRNLSAVRHRKEKVAYKTEEDIQRLEASMIKQPNKEILAHEQKRRVELRVIELQDLMEDQGYSQDEIETKVATFRQMLVEKEGEAEKQTDEHGRPMYVDF
ncbi:PREDICTED: pre-mRNA-splicing factor cwc-21-like [Priapulus caudatus]|uniref:Pre-mRNA-splicing factor cwc-21-like n=1 Tax=Priapulus caudatus TaxID=37621 RepID=A0ABM1EAE7_PRICU|nr:PREDICTED: pre-mRNA-splicing factor cwc-21-like [Priapulus caudatus]XP_014669168.1 PREDICTED: pre-mRNA-splicing factor cwc-21-like [Priapulus caudatus]